MTDVLEVAELRRHTATSPQPYVARLLCFAGDEVGRSYLLDRLPAVIGREAGADICLAGADISRQHCRISRDGTRLVLEDLGSTNGTTVNGAPVRTHALQIGDRIQVGGTLLVYAHHDDLERRVVQLQKLQSLGTLAATLAHDLKNLFAILGANLSFVDPRAGRADPETIEGALADMRIALGRGDELVQRLLQFGRRDSSPESTLVDVSALTAEAVSMVGRTLRGVTIGMEVARGLCVRTVAADLQQVVLNLLFNARDAMPGGGHLRVQARSIELRRDQALACHLATGGMYVELIVSDDGIGMDQETQARIFEPFFTTKPVGVGTGLGLSSVYGIVRNLGGNVLVESSVGRGSTFRVLLPAAR